METSPEFSDAFFVAAFHTSTLDQLVFLKRQVDWRRDDVDAMLCALVLGILHGEQSGRYLSNQMPRTISTKPDYSVRFWASSGCLPLPVNVFTNIAREIEFRYESETAPRSGKAILGDMRQLPYHEMFRKYQAKLVLTSPPYWDTTSFEEDQWLRLWFLVGNLRPTRGKISTDDRIVREDSYWRMIADFWRMTGAISADSSHVVVRIGGKGFDPSLVTRRLTAAALFSGRKVDLVHSEVSEIKRSQIVSFRPGLDKVKFEVDCHFALK